MPAEPDGGRGVAATHYAEVAGALTGAARRRVEAFLAAPVPPEGEGAALCHNDLSAEHLVVHPATDELAGVLDWGDAALTDPCRDFGRLYRDLGSTVVDDILACYDGRLGRTARRRIVFYARCALLEDLAHGLRTGDGRYSDAALANLGRVFSEQR